MKKDLLFLRILTWLAKKLHVQKIIGHKTFSQGERSDLAELAADLL